IGHRVIVPMIIAGLLSYVLADATVAFASMSAFFASEIIDWGLFTYTKKPLSQRLFWSAAASSPVDTFIFLSLMGRANSLAFTVMTLTKILGVIAFVLIWRRINQPGTGAVVA
ncbi:MAG: preQ0 transporter, partial [Pseudomonadota bacterium]|nr:preQ0 transporter [Pseudomonadota bacterium]